VSSQALQDLQQGANPLWEALPVGFFRMTPEGQFIAANRVLLDLLGFPSLADFAVACPSRPRVSGTATASEALPAIPNGRATRWQHQDGTALAVRERLHALRDLEGNVLLYEGTVASLDTRPKEAATAQHYAAEWFHTRQALEWATDEVQRLQEALADTQRKLDLLRQEAQVSHRARSAFLADMSHEIRTPMNAVIGMTHLLLSSGLDPEQRDYAETIRVSSEALLGIINDILDLSKIESGRLELETQPFSLRDSLEKALDLVAAPAHEKGLDLTYQVDPTLPDILLGDATRFRQIVLNLLSNAVKFTARGEVTLTVVSQPASAPDRVGVQVSVRDTGIGLSPEQQAQLFQAFVQAEASITRKYGGTGLGLTICKRLVELMGGRIWVESVEGQGAIFHVAVEVLRSEATGDIPTGPVPVLAGKSALVVAPNETNRQALSRTLSAWGMDVRTAASGQEALDLAATEVPFQTFFVDLCLDDVDGLVLAERLRDQLKTPALPYVLLVPMGQPMPLEKPREALGLHKPIKHKTLFQGLSELFTTRAPSDRLEQHPPPPAAEPSPAALRILLAEDNLINQKVALLLLERMGYRADVAQNGREVLDAVEHIQYDVVLLDVQMPEMDGLEASRLLCQRYLPEQRPRLIAMTANATTADRDACFEAGMDAYLSKPIRPEKLSEALQQCVVRQNTLKEDDFLAEVQTSVRQQMAALHEDDPNFLADLLNSYLNTVPGLLHDMGQYLTGRNHAALLRAAHTLKSSSMLVGLMRLASLSKALELATRSEDATPTLLGHIRAISQEFQRVRPVLVHEREALLANRHPLFRRVVSVDAPEDLAAQGLSSFAA
jgi:signal transduction histidine kinase/CheY-like chemotaxis protein